jgi:hypothetical protein
MTWMVGRQASLAFEMKSFCLLSFFAFLFISNARAGAAGGPYVIWVNLSENAQIEQTIASRIESYSNCRRPRLVITPLPDWISKNLVKDAIIKKNKNSLRSLRALLKKPYSDLISDGFDGLIAYDETGAPRFSAISLVWPKIISENLPPNSSEKEQWELFCTFIPPVGRPNL